jgi:WD40 repeat protein
VTLKVRRLSQWKNKHPILSLSFQPKTSTIFIGDKLGNIHCYDFKGGLEISTFKSHKYPIMAIEFCGDHLYTFDQLQNLVSWNLETLQPKKTHSLCIQGWEREKNTWPKPDLNAPWTVATALFTSDGKYLVFGVNSAPGGGFSGFDKLYSIETGTASLTREFEFSTRDVGLIDSIKISRDNTQLSASGLEAVYDSLEVCSAYCEYIYQWCIESAEKVCTYVYNPLFRLNEHEKINLAFSPDTKQILSSSKSYSSLWNVPPLDSRELTVLDEKELFLHGVVDWSPVDNSLVAFGSSSGFLTLIDIAEDEILFEERVSQSEIQKICFSHTGEFLAVSYQDLTFEIWEISDL